MSRNVVQGKEVAHLWAHQAQTWARNSGKTIYFEKRTIYSYGSHFPIASIVKTKTGEVILFNSDRHSVTTSKHQSWVRHAIPSSFDVFTVPSIPSNERTHFDMHIVNANHYRETIQHLINRAARAKSDLQKRYLTDEITATLAEADRYAAAFKCKKIMKLPKLPANWEAYASELRTKTAKKAAETRKREAAAKAKRIEQAAEAIAKWQAGDNVSLPYDIPTMLRIKTVTTDGDTSETIVQTSRGASVPIEHAIRGLRIVRAVMHSGKEYQRNGHTEHLGPYAVDRITTDGTLYAGCHVITWDEIEKIAPQLDAMKAGE
jgi:hypothetical protein